MVTSWVLFSRRLLFCFRICANTKLLLTSTETVFLSARRTLRRICLKQVGTLPRSQATDILDQALSMRVSDSLVHVHSDLIYTVDEFTVKSREQVFLHHMLLREEVKIIEISARMNIVNSYKPN